MGPLTTPAARTFVAPARYVQGPGVVDSLGELVSRRWGSAAVLVDAQLADTVGRRVMAALGAAGVGTEFATAEGEVTPARIAALADDARPGQPEVVIAVGGGKVLDQGKGVSRLLGVPVVTVPTIASNDGPASRVIAMYDDDHRLVETPHLLANPELVVVDTEVIAAAPARFLQSGIADALAKKFEADACRRAGGRNSHGQSALVLPAIIADGCYKELLEHGGAALAGDQDALERVVEAAVLMSGLAFENGGLSLAHAMTRGFMACPGADAHLHGFHVAYGLLVQLAHEAEPEYEVVRSFLADTGLPCSLHALDASTDDSTRQALAQSVLDSPHHGNCDPRPTLTSVIAAIDKVEHDASVGPRGDERSA